MPASLVASITAMASYWFASVRLQRSGARAVDLDI